MSRVLPSSKSASSGVTIATGGSSGGGKVSRLKLTTAKNVCIRPVRAAINTLGIGPFSEISDIIQGLSSVCKSVPEYELEYGSLVQQLEADLELVRQAMLSSQSPAGDGAMADIVMTIEGMLAEAAQIERLHPVSKRLNSTEIFERIHELKNALYRLKADTAFRFTIMSMTQRSEVEEPETIRYQEVLWGDISVTDTTVYQVEEYDPAEQSLVSIKSISKARYRNRDACFIEYSGTVSRKKKYELLMQDLRQCITGRHGNVLQLIGGSTETTATSQPYLVFEAGGELDHVDFLRKTTSLNDLITFVRGVEKGSAYMFGQRIIYRDGISVSCKGVATVHPPGIKLQELTGRQSTKRWAGSILHDVGSKFNDAILPIHEIYQILYACNHKELRTRVEDALMGVETLPQKQQIFEIAEDFKVPLKLTWRCVSKPDHPDFIIKPGSFGIFTGDNSGRSQAPFTHWEPLISNNSTSDVTNPTSSFKDWMDKLTTRVTTKNGRRSTFKDGDIPTMKQNIHTGWLSFENVMRNARGLNSPCLVVLHYGNAPLKRFDNYQAAFDSFAEKNIYPPRVVHFVRGINLRVIFNLQLNQINVPVYFHRQPHSQSPRNYWGFLSQSADPTIPPKSNIRDIKISYQVDVVTALDGDSWGFRADQEHDQYKYARIPGAWIA